MCGTHEAYQTSIDTNTGHRGRPCQWTSGSKSKDLCSQLTHDYDNDDDNPDISLVHLRLVSLDLS